MLKKKLTISSLSSWEFQIDLLKNKTFELLGWLFVRAFQISRTGLLLRIRMGET